MIPSKLKVGDGIRVISPSRSLAIIPQECRKIAEERFSEIGLKLSFSRNSEELDEFDSSTIQSRVDDIHEAFQDDGVKAIITTIGGFNSNQLLHFLDYNLIKENPKIICGFSDITALLNSIYKKSGLITYNGPHFSTFGMKLGFSYTLEYFKKCLFSTEQINLNHSDLWSDDLKWFVDQDDRKFIKNDGYITINEGECEGKILGGNLGTLNLIQGTEFMPDLSNSILFIEESSQLLAGDYFPSKFDRNLQSLIFQKGFDKVKGIVIGRFQIGSKINHSKIIKIIKSKRELRDIPIIYNADFGHTSPIITFPIGGLARLCAKNGNVQLEIIEH